MAWGDHRTFVDLHAKDRKVPVIGGSCWVTWWPVNRGGPRTPPRNKGLIWFNKALFLGGYDRQSHGSYGI